MTALEQETNRQAGELRPSGFLGWRPPGDRMRHAMKAGASSALGFGAVSGLRIVQQIYIANKIGSADYGRVGLVGTVVVGLALLSEIGLSQNIVQSKRGDDPDFLDTAYAMSVIRGLLLWLIASALAYPVGWFYDDPTLVGMLVITASSTAIRGFVSSSIWTLTRHVQVHTITVLNVSSEVLGFCVALAWVLVDPSPWALIAGAVSASVAYTIGSMFIGRRPRWAWSPDAGRELISFGVWLFISTATYFAASQAERLALGKFITKEDLGCFTMAVTMATAPTRALGQLIEQVFFPMIARLCREDPPRSLLQFRRVKWISLGLAAAASAVCILGGPLAVKLLLAPEYKPAGWMLQLLGFRAAFDILTSPTVNMLFANGQTKFAGLSNVVRLCIMVPGLWVSLSRYGLREAVWVLTLAPIAAYCVTMHAIAKHLRPAFGVEALTVSILLACSAAFAILYRLLH